MNLEYEDYDDVEAQYITRAANFNIPDPILQKSTYDQLRKDVVASFVGTIVNWPFFKTFYL